MKKPSWHQRKCEECNGHGVLVHSHPDDPDARERSCPRCHRDGVLDCIPGDCCGACESDYRDAESQP